MLNMSDIMETITMIQEENLDIRTITMGISLADCADGDIDIEGVLSQLRPCAYGKAIPVAEGVALRRFSTELCELGEGLQLEIDSSTCFADIFLDNIFTDAMVRSLVWDAGQDVSGILDRIRERLGGLRPELERSRSVESGLNAEYERLVLGE